MASRDHMHRMYFPEGRKFVTSQHAALNKDEVSIVRCQKAGAFVEKEYPDNRISNERHKMAPRNYNKSASGEFDGEDRSHRNRKNKLTVI